MSGHEVLRELRMLKLLTWQSRKEAQVEDRKLSVLDEMEVLGQVNMFACDLIEAIDESGIPGEYRYELLQMVSSLAISWDPQSTRRRLAAKSAKEGS